MTDVTQSQAEPASAAIVEKVQFGLIFVASFTAFFGKAAVARLRRQSQSKRSIFAEAWDASATVTRYAFMG